MNQRDYVKKYLSQKVIANDCLAKTMQENIINGALDRFDKSHYFTLDDLLKDTAEMVAHLSALEMPTTAANYAIETGLHIGTARKRLSDVESVECNKESRPYIYKLIEV